MVNGSAGDFCVSQREALFVTFRGKTDSGKNRLLLEARWPGDLTGLQEPIRRHYPDRQFRAGTSTFVENHRPAPWLAILPRRGWAQAARNR